MSKLPDDFSTAYDYVKDTLLAAMSICINIINEEEAKESQDQVVINKYEQILDNLYGIRKEIMICDRQRMQEIHDEYVLFVRCHRNL